MKPAITRVLIAAAILGAFVLGWFANRFVDFLQEFGGPHVRSDSVARASLSSIEMPPTAYRIYSATEGFVDADDFMAFSAEPAIIDKFLRSRFNVKVTSLSDRDSIPERVVRYGPDSWKGQYWDPNWDLTKCTHLAVHEAERLTLIYARDQNRLFICIWGE